MQWRRQWVSVAYLAAACLALAGCADKLVTPDEETVALEIVPTFAQASAQAADLDRLHILIASVAGETSKTVKDTTVDIGPDGTVDIELLVPFQRDPETYLITLAAIRSTDNFAAYGGSSLVTITRDQASEAQTVQVEVVYLGLPTSRVEIAPKDTIVQAGANFTLRATAYNSQGQMTPSLFTYSLVNVQDASLLTVNAETGAVTVAAGAQGQVLVRVSTPDNGEDQSLISIGPFQPLHAWIVDPTNALPLPQQFGTAAYPFSTITQGLDRAGAGDTVFVKIAVYNEPLNTTKPVVVLGETLDASFPIVTSPGALGSMTSTGLVKIKNIYLAGGNGPLTLQGTIVQLDSVYLQAAQGTVLDISATQSASLYEVYVTGSTGTAAARGIHISNTPTASIRTTLVTNTPGPGLRTDNVTTLEIVDSEFSLAGIASDTTFALEVVGADSVRVDSTNFVDNYGGAALLLGTRAFAGDFNDVFGSHFTASEPNGLTLRSSFAFVDVATATVTNSFFSSNIAASVLVLYQTVNGHMVIQNNSFDGNYWGVNGFAGDTLKGHIEIIGNSFVGSYGSGPATRVVGVGPVRALIANNNQILGAFGEAFSAHGDSVLIDHNTISESDGLDAIGVGGGRLIVIDNNAITCANSVNQHTGIAVFDGSGTISNNTVTGCIQGGYADNSTTGGNYTLDVVNNTFQTDGITPPLMGFQVQGSAYTVTITGNTVQGGAYEPYAGIAVLGNVGPMVSADVTGNTLMSGTGRAIGITNVNSLTMDDNSVTGFGTTPSPLGIVAQLEDLNTTARVRNNQFTNNTTQGIYITGKSSDVLFETNNLANNTGPGLWTGTPTTGADVITAQFNTFQGQSTHGVLVTQMGGTFQNNNFITNGVGFENQSTLAINATNNWWNDLNGPAGCSTCSGQSTGDQLVDPNNTVTFLPFASARIAGAPDVRSAPFIAGGATPAAPPPLAVFVDASATGNATIRRVRPGGINGTVQWAPFLSRRPRR